MVLTVRLLLHDLEVLLKPENVISALGVQVFVPTLSLSRLLDSPFSIWWLLSI